jgi:hypothetical protein
MKANITCRDIVPVNLNQRIKAHVKQTKSHKIAYTIYFHLVDISEKCKIQYEKVVLILLACGLGQLLNSNGPKETDLIAAGKFLRPYCYFLSSVIMI